MWFWNSNWGAEENLVVNTNDNRVFMPLANLMFLKLAYLPFSSKSLF